MEISRKTKQDSQISSKFPADWFPYGAVLSNIPPCQVPVGKKLAEWKSGLLADLASMAEHGMTAVGIIMHWEMIETTADKFDFSRFDPIMEKANQLNLRIVVWPWEQFAPKWVARDNPDWRWEADDGSRPPECSWHHPDFRERVYLFLQRVVEHYRDVPSMFMWNVAIEPAYRVSMMDGLTLSYMDGEQKMYDYQAATVERFRQWLKKRYNNLDQLNYKWVSDYSEWNEVVPPRYNPHFFLCNARFIDWRLFWNEELAEYQNSKARLIKKIDPAHPTTGNSYHDTDRVFGGPDNHLVSKEFDSWGISWFPIYHFGRASLTMENRNYSYIRSVCYPDKPYFVHEMLGAAPVSGINIGETPDPQEIRQWSWQSVSHGFRGIFFWLWHPRKSGPEAGGFGVAGLDLSDNPLTKAAAETSKELQKIAPVINHLRPVQPQVAIVNSSVNTIFSYAIGRRTSDIKQKQIHADSFNAYTNIMYKLRIPVHIMTESYLKELIDGNLTHIKFLILPYLPLVDKEHLVLLDDFVKRGGMLWSDPWLGQRNETTECRDTTPPDPLKQRVGCIQGQVRPIIGNNEINRANAWRGNSVIEKGLCKTNLPGLGTVNLMSAIHEISLNPFNGGEIIGVFRNGQPGLIRKQSNSGTTYYCGSFFSLLTRSKYRQKEFGEVQKSPGTLSEQNVPVADDTDILRLFRYIMIEKGIFPPIESIDNNPSNVEANLLTCENDALAVFINHSKDSLSGNWRIQTGFPVDSETQARDVLTGKPFKIISRGKKGIDLAINLPRYGIATVRIDKNGK